MAAAELASTAGLAVDNSATAVPPPTDSSVHHQYNFSFLPHLLRTHRFGIPPERPHCANYRAGTCSLGSACPDKHPITNTSSNLICKHWLKGLCKKGDACDFLHEYNIRARADCRQYIATSGYCIQGDDCNYLHPDLDIVEERRRPLCEWYERGHCRLGPQCAKKHVKKSKICPFYMAGFCPLGRQCGHGAHARWRDDSILPRGQRRPNRSREEIEAERERQRQEAEERDVREWERGDNPVTNRLRGRGKRPFAARPRRGF